MNASMQLVGLVLAVLLGGESAAQPAEAARAKVPVQVQVKEYPRPLPEPPAVPDRHGTPCAQVPTVLGKRHRAPGSCDQGQAHEKPSSDTIDKPSSAPGAAPSAKAAVRIGSGGIMVQLDPSVIARRLRQPPRQPRQPQQPESGMEPQRPLEPPLESQPKPPPKTLPDLRGMTCQVAARTLAALHAQYAGCEVGASVGGHSPGRINGQSPAPGAVLPLRTALVLNVQPPPAPTPTPTPTPPPPPPVEVPPLVGLAESQALQQLSARGLQANANGPPAATGRRVIGQAPTAGAKVRPGSAVGMRMGLTVPRLLGLDCASARQAAAGYGHDKVRCESRPADTPGRAIGKVFEQEPPSDQPPQPAAAAIRVVVWAAQPVAVPDVRERPLKDALGMLGAAKLVARPDATTGDRDVRTQDPRPHAVVNVGSVVRLGTTLMAKVPNVVDSPLGEARDKLTHAQFGNTPDATDPAGDRFVIRQTPSAGTRAPQGSQVALGTERRAFVPELVGKTCEEARTAIAPSAFTLRCEDEKSWRTRVFGAPLIAVQSPPGGARAALPVEVSANATVRLPHWLRWLANISAPVLAVGIGTPLALALALVFWRWPPGPKPLSVPLVPPVPTVSTHWRVDPDPDPAVGLRMAAADHDGPHTRIAAAWRVVPDPGVVTLREFTPDEGAPHDHR